ncbi:2'-5' RNA ligase family protein [Streptomyces sp. NPDC006140]|uniref:2'-5' RNA ligase family protein n=1 Tax=Streptomyces sp. NPDC006140 TaxID=3154579 RepID=UPI0033C4DDB3
MALAHDVDERQLHDLVEAVQAEAPPAFELSALPLTGSRGALRYSVAPWTPIISLHQRLVAASFACGLPPMKSSSRLRPHIGIGYCRTRIPARPVQAVVKPLRSLPPVPLLIDRLDLVEMRREAAAYTWKMVRTVHLSLEGAR